MNGLAKQMSVLIAGRTVQGLGGGCLMSMMYILFTDLAPLHLRPRYQAMLTTIYGVASVVGPLIGGAFVDRVNWHWDFWINVIFSVISFMLIFLLLKEPVALQKSSFFSKIKRIDWLGSIFAVGFICCLLLALSWGNDYGWSDAHSIGPFVGSGVSLILLIVTEGWIAPEPLIPPEVILNPAVIVIYCYTACLGLGFIGTLYFGPIYFQSVFGADSTQSGTRLIPFMILLIASSLGSSFVIRYFPYIKAYLVIGSIINVIGYGLFYTINEHSTWGQQAGYIAFCGFAVGISQQNTILGVQTLVKREYIAVATGLNNFFLLLASSIGVAVYQTILQVLLKENLKSVDPSIIAEAMKYGAIKNYLYIRKMPIDIQEPIIHAYVQSLRIVFLIPLVSGGVGIICSAFVKNIRYGVPPDAKKTEIGEKS
ncbi:hypothetical protein DFQ30_008692 [Apophysomyces sp. BC1015]|nr:hypothetical protein DFQ30_008692 [Apophysomyces sp. BC1015]